MTSEENAGDLPGQSVLGDVSSPTTSSNVPAHASLLVKKLDERLNIFFIVAGMDECSNSESGVGPFGALITNKIRRKKHQSMF